MITQKRNLLRALIFGVALAVASATTTLPPSIEPTQVMGLFQQPVAAPEEYDFDTYVPYRSDTHDTFSWDLVKLVLEQEHSANVIISPFSVKLVLAILAEAAGNGTLTKTELVATQTDIRSVDNIRSYYKKILAALKTENPYYTLKLGTKLYTDTFIKPMQRYAAILSDMYDTDIECLVFADSERAASRINAWASNVTNGRLDRLVTKDNVQNNVMLMANAVYFNALWRREFNNNTFDGPFFRTPTEQIKVEYMELTDYFWHYDASSMNAKILRLPYKGKKFSMFVLLPKAKDGLDELMSGLENAQLKRMQWNMQEVKIKVTLPKFKFEFNKSLKETLIQLGIGEIFTDSASLPGLDRGGDVAQRLKVSDIYQKAGIDVNEKGTEAFAATVVEIENKFGGNTIDEFNVNRPFAFFIEEEATGNILFAGKVVEPFI